MAGPQILRVGILGCGRIADLQSLGYRAHPQAEIVAVCDRDEARARHCAQAWGARSVTTDVGRFLADPQIDAVEILTPHHLHAQHAIAALEAGKHVSLQKPPTRSLEELGRVAEAAARAATRGVAIRVCENFSWYPPHRKALALVEEGAIGTPLSIRIKTAAGRPLDGWAVTAETQAWRLDPALCGGGATTFDHGYHCFQMGRLFMPVEPDCVHAFIHWIELGDGRRIDAPALISWRYAGDVPRFGSWEVIASLGMRVRSQYYVSDDRMEIHGSDGILWINRCTGQLLDEPSLVLYRDGETRAFHDLETDWAASFRIAGEAFVDALLAGRAPAQDLADARLTLAFALAAARSAEQNREVQLGELLT
jgi:predicted dehydrogenase